MDHSGSTGRARGLVADNKASLIDFNGLATSVCGSVMTCEASVMCNPAMIDKALRAGEVLSSTIKTNELDEQAVRLALLNDQPSLVFRLRVSAGQRLQLATSSPTARLGLHAHRFRHTTSRPALERIFARQNGRNLIQIKATVKS
jgi:hypothetical protein